MDKIIRQNGKEQGVMKKNLKLFLFLFLFPLVFQAGKAEAARLYFSPDFQPVFNQESFLVEIKIDTEGEEINAVEGHISFFGAIEPIGFVKGGSVFSLWIEEPKIGGSEVSFSGGAPGGFNGENLLLKIIFLTKGNGENTIFFKDNSAAFLNDGKGTKAGVSFSSARVSVVEKTEEIPIIISKTHPDQNQWYKENTLSLYWDLEGEEYSWDLSFSSQTEPDEKADRPEGELMWIGAMEYKGLEDGIYYFNLKKKLSSENWSQKITFRAMIDKTPPKGLEFAVAKNDLLFEGKYFLSFFAEDKTSGIDHYEVIEESYGNIFQEFFKQIFFKGENLGAGMKKWEAAESPYLLKDQELQSRIFIKAKDKAGNYLIETIEPPYKLKTDDIILLVLLFVLFGTCFFTFFKEKERFSI